MMNKLKIALAGLGTIGSGLVQLLAQSSVSDRFDIRYVLVRDSRKNRPHLPSNAVLTTDLQTILNDADVDVVVELMGGVSDAYRVVSQTLKSGKAVVTANKNLLAEKGPELFRIAHEKGVPIGFEASVCAGIPIVRTLQEALRADRLESIEGIVNGTTNYILTRMSEDRSTYQSALLEAQQKGFAEPDPDYDVSGKDAVCKAGILATLAFGSYVDFRKVPTNGIETLDAQDIVEAEKMGYRVKLVASAQKLPNGKIVAEVGPVLIPFDHPLATVRLEYNAVLLQSFGLGRTLYEGKGAGPFPTSVSLLADLLDIADGRAFVPGANHAFLQTEAALEDQNSTESRFYLRFQVPDRPGILAYVAGLFAAQNISISSVLQPENVEGSSLVSLILTTHEASRGNLSLVLESLAREGWAKPVVLRIQEK